MKIDFVEINNFRKLQCCRIRFDKEKTLLVGANNSGKTSAMIALRKFFLSPSDIELRDITIGNWASIDDIGLEWENPENSPGSINGLLPSLDIWLDVPVSQIHHVVHIIPNMNWLGGAIGVRLQYEVINEALLKEHYLTERTYAKKIEASEQNNNNSPVSPKNLVDYLERRLSRYLTVRAYSLDPVQRAEPDGKGRACPQKLSNDALELEGDIFKNLIDIREIPAMRDFSATSSSGPKEDETYAKSNRLIRSLSDHVRSYYDKHVDSADEAKEEDIAAFYALHHAEKSFDKRLKTGFDAVFSELKDLGVPGVNNPSIVINAKFRTLDGISHASAVQYKVSDAKTEAEERYLPESYAGLGYQNLIAMIFLLMRFRQDWIEPKNAENMDISIAPLQLIMIEEPEAHLHAQVQQVFIKKAYDVLRNHLNLKNSESYTTQLLVSTHSSHIAHEVDFANLRYFRRLPPLEVGQAPTSSVICLSNVFGEDKDTLRFVKRYIKATDCDLFFADAVIFVEGQAERILVPHFIRHHFDNLWRRYISLIDLGGSNAPRFAPLVRALGLTTLIITDLDAGLPTSGKDVNDKEIMRIKKAKPKANSGQVTTNPTLKSWYPKLDKIDDLLSVSAEGHNVVFEDEYDLYQPVDKSRWL